MSELGALRADEGRRSIRFERRYAAPPDEVWDALIDPERLARWLAPGTIGEHEVELDFGEGGSVTGRVLRREPPTLLELEWRFPGEDESVVRFELARDGDGTRLVLEHRALDAGRAVGYGAGWHAHLEALRDLLEDRDGGSWDDRFAAVLPAYRNAGSELG